MMELGNEMINKIFEATYDETTSDIPRATENCDAAVREKWIRLKYVEKKFVLPFCDAEAQLLAGAGLPNKFSNLPNKWSVKKIRRRSNRKSNNNNNNHHHNSKITKKELNGEEEKDKNDDILVLGENIIESSSLLMEMPVFPMSDQESTSGDEEILDEEEIDKLNPDFALFKASGAHNLPVMCQAMALNADKNWANPECEGRTPIHQAILSGSIMATEFLLLNGAKLMPLMIMDLRPCIWQRKLVTLPWLICY
jgi:Arf-GAP/coiled-coil/ANK repeat/PH domain-containing protein